MASVENTNGFSFEARNLIPQYIFSVNSHMNSRFLFPWYYCTLWYFSVEQVVNLTF